MSIDPNLQKIMNLLMKRWKLLVIFTVIGAMVAYVYTANFTTLYYTSSVEFLAYVNDGTDDVNDSTDGDVLRTSNTSKMNYAMKMINTYVEIFQTNEFNTQVALDLNKNLSTQYTSKMISSAMKIELIEETAMFKVTITTDDADKSYEIAKQLEKSIPKRMSKTNNGLVLASVEDQAIRATTAVSLNFPKKCAVGAIIGLILSAIYAILRDLLDIRVKGTDDLMERYEIPILGSVPDFGNKKSSESKRKKAELKRGAKNNG